jgi:hypothetical protein
VSSSLRHCGLLVAHLMYRCGFIAFTSNKHRLRQTTHFDMFRKLPNTSQRSQISTSLHEHHLLLHLFASIEGSRRPNFSSSDSQSNSSALPQPIYPSPAKSNHSSASAFHLGRLVLCPSLPNSEPCRRQSNWRMLTCW